MKVDRRTILIGGGAGVGLVVAWAFWPRRLGSDLAEQRGEHAFGPYIKIGRDGRVTVAVPQTETGQGIWTGLPQIVADELGSAWDMMAVEPAPLIGDYGNPIAGDLGWLDHLGTMRARRIASDGRSRITAEASSVRAFHETFRRSAAIAREMLVGAAADRWNVDPKECGTADGMVINGGKTFGFGELAEEAADRVPPRRPALRAPATDRLIGKPLPRLDGPAKASGSWRFAGDVRLPGMMFGSVRVAPPEGRLIDFRRDVAGRMPGVRQLVARETWIAVVAETWWSAEQALHAASPVFSGEQRSQDVRPLFEDALANGSSRQHFHRGDYEGAVAGSRPLAATYFVAPSQHLGLEPLSATARFVNGAAELWTASQAPGLTRHSAVEATSAGTQLALYPMPAGAPSGRALEADAAPYAIELARVVKAPVNVTLSQSVSQNHDPLAAGALARMTALPGQGGITAAWRMQIATSSGIGAAISRLLGAEDRGRVVRNAVSGIPPYAIPNMSVEAVRPQLPFRIGYMRGSPQRELTFATESFIDELAHAAGMEPLGFRMSMLGENGRLARCLQAAARRAQWDGGGAGSTMGLAGCSAYGSHIALVATASIGDDQRIKVHRLVAAVDCGRAINIGLVQQQVAGELIWAIAQATVDAPEWIAGMPRARPVRALALPRIADTPEIIVDVIVGSDDAGGVSGLGTSVLAPAVANAIHAGTGKRMRELPFVPM